MHIKLKHLLCLCNYYTLNYLNSITLKIKKLQSYTYTRKKIYKQFSSYERDNFASLACYEMSLSPSIKFALIALARSWLKVSSTTNFLLLNISNRRQWRAMARYAAILYLICMFVALVLISSTNICPTALAPHKRALQYFALQHPSERTHTRAYTQQHIFCCYLKYFYCALLAADLSKFLADLCRGGTLLPHCTASMLAANVLIVRAQSLHTHHGHPPRAR